MKKKLKMFFFKEIRTYLNPVSIYSKEANNVRNVLTETIAGKAPAGRLRFLSSNCRTRYLRSSS